MRHQPGCRVPQKAVGLPRSQGASSWSLRDANGCSAPTVVSPPVVALQKESAATRWIAQRLAEPVVIKHRLVDESPIDEERVPSASSRAITIGRICRYEDVRFNTGPGSATQRRASAPQALFGDVSEAFVRTVEQSIYLVDETKRVHCRAESR
jgi:hypothetical protein